MKVCFLYLTGLLCLHSGRVPFTEVSMLNSHVFSIKPLPLLSLKLFFYFWIPTTRCLSFKYYHHGQKLLLMLLVLLCGPAWIWSWPLRYQTSTSISGSFLSFLFLFRTLSAHLFHLLRGKMKRRLNIRCFIIVWLHTNGPGQMQEMNVKAASSLHQRQDDLGDFHVDRAESSSENSNTVGARIHQSEEGEGGRGRGGGEVHPERRRPSSWTFLETTSGAERTAEQPRCWWRPTARSSKRSRDEESGGRERLTVGF